MKFDLKDYTKSRCFVFESDDTWTHEILLSSCLLRIADSVEAMAKSHVKMQSDIDYLKAKSKRLSDRNDVLEKRVAAYKGHFNRVKKEKCIVNNDEK